MIGPFLEGALTLAYLLAGMMFLKFWRLSRDRFFGWFATAFGVLGVASCFHAFGPLASDHVYYVYVPRVLAFLLILVAIIDKNRRDR